MSGLRFMEGLRRRALERGVEPREMLSTALHEAGTIGRAAESLEVSRITYLSWVYRLGGQVVHTRPSISWEGQGE